MSLIEEFEQRAQARAAQDTAWEKQLRTRREQDAREREAREVARVKMDAVRAARKPYDLLGLRFTPVDGGVAVSFVETDARLREPRDVVAAIYEGLCAAAEGRPASYSLAAQQEKFQREEQARQDAEARKAEQEAEARKAEELAAAEKLVRDYDAAKALLKASGKGGK